jgi:hypothetical protein
VIKGALIVTGEHEGLEPNGRLFQVAAIQRFSDSEWRHEMKLPGYRTTLLLSVAALLATILLFTTCQRPGPTSNAAALQFKSIPVPSRVFSIAREVLAFQAIGEAGRTAEVPVSLRQLQSRLGGFERALVYEYNKDGKVLSQQELTMDSDAGIAIKATTGNSYLVFADLGPRFSNSYQVVCSLGHAGIAGQAVPRICTQIFCTDSIFPASQLKERIPELQQQVSLELGDGPIGGFGGHGSICDQCVGNQGPDGTFLPTRGCSDFVPVVDTPAAPPPAPETIIYTHSNFPTVSNFHYQIFKIKSDGADPVNLSNNENFERSPDVNHKTGKIVFDSTGGGGLTTMDLNGNNRTIIPKTFLGGNPKWSRNDEAFVVYTNLVSNVNNSLHRVRPDGSDNAEIVKAGEGNVIRTADVVDDDHVVFSRDSGGFDGDLFIKDMRDTSDAVNLTNTPDSHESYPVISHNGALIAYLVEKPKDFKRVEIHIARLTLPGTITDIHVIHLDVPAGRYLRDLDFSNDDTRVYVSSSVIETEDTTNTDQLFSISVDGSGQLRVTLNSESDFEPSVAPR